MSDRQNWSRLVASIFALTLVSAFAFATIAPRSFTSLFTAEATAVEPATQLATAPADDPEGGAVCTTAGPIELQSSGGTTTPTAYATLKAAFDAVILGTHTGSITIEVCGNTTETATAALTASGVGAASYTSISIRPVGAGRIIEGSIVGAIVRLQGADNVTIDGRQNGSGNARDLTIRNNNVSTATAAVWLSSVAAGNGATSNVVRNLEIAAGQTANVGTNTTIGVLIGGTTISLTSTDGNDNDNNQIMFNRITRARYGIATRGVTTNNNEGIVISDNTVGPNSFGADEIGKAGIFLQADTGALVTRNTVQFVGGDLANTTGGADRCGICIGSEGWSATDSTTITSSDYTVTKNVVHDVIEERLFSSVGIRLGTTRSGTPTNNLVANNFIYNIRSNGTGGDQPVGVGISGGNGDRVVFNSISITGDMDPGAAGAPTTYGNAIRIPGANAANNANFTIANNSIYLDASSSSTAAQRYYAITLNGAAYVFGTGFLNNNNYYINPANTQLQTGGLGTATTSSITTQFATLANWQAALTAPQDANSIQADPLNFSNTSDLHIPTSSPNINFGTAIAGITDDIDEQVRPNGPSPDIGADEFYALPGNLQLSSTTYAGNEGATATATINRVLGSTGTVGVTYTLTDGTATGGASCSGGVDYVNPGPQPVSFADGVTSQPIVVTLCSDAIVDALETFSVTISTPTGGASLGSPTSATVTITDVPPPFSGVYNVGSGQTYTSLTNTAGIFEGLNLSGATGNVTINITSDLTGENGTVALNELAGGFSVLIKPSGGNRSITGSSTNSIIRLNGADNVTIDGSLTGDTATGIGGNAALRNLTVQNTNTAATAGAVIAIIQGANSANNNIVKNVIVSGQDPTQTLIGIHIGGNAIGAAPTVASNNNVIVDNCAFKRSFIAVFNDGVSPAIPATGNVISHNDITATGADRMRRAGVFAFNHNGIQIRENAIGGIVGDEGADAIGIIAGVQNVTTTVATSGGISNAIIAKNRISGIASTNTTGFSAVGIAIAGDPAGENFIGNNMVSGVVAPSTSPDFVAGIFVAGVVGSNTHLLYNSVSVTGDRGAIASQIGSYGVAISGTNPIVELKNNIFFNTQTSGGGASAKTYAIGMTSATFTNLSSNYNDFFTSGANAAGFRTGSIDTAGTDLANLAAWQAATGGDVNSISADPLFVNSSTDLHLQTGSPAQNAGVVIALISDDIDGNPRGTMPDIGADEIFVAAPGTIAFSFANYGVLESSPTVTLTVNRTGGSDGAISVNYATSDGVPALTERVPELGVSTPATGGASCTAGIDYITASGTLNFANGETSKTINVSICDDNVYEGAEAFSATLSTPTGGATIGTPNPTVVTITDNETQPTVQFSSATYSTIDELNELSGGGVINVTLSGPSQSSVSVNYATVAGGTATGGASCLAGVDYINTSGTLTFLTGEVSKLFFVPTCLDNVDEPDETVNLALSLPVGATLGIPNAAVLTLIDNDGPAAPVTVTATAGTTGPTPYNTVKEAFDAINAGTHQGAITVSINQNTTETATAALNASGGTSSYTSVLVRPTAPVTVSGSITGAIIRLNGADNVTIDGRIGGIGSGRDLSVINNQSVTATAAIWLSSNGAGAGATNNVIRNLEIACGANQSTGTLNSFGIFMGGATIAVATNGEDNDTNSFIANRIIRSRYGIATRGNPANLNLGTVVSDNIIGPAAFGADQIGKVGIFLQADDGAVVSRNTVQFVGGAFANTTAGADRVGIALGVESWAAAPTTLAGTGYTVTRNIIHDVIEERTFSAVGILASATNGANPTNNLIANNFVYNVNANGTAGDTAIGIGVAAGNGDRVVFNSVRMAGDSDPNPGATLPTQDPMNLRVANTPTNLTVKNNSLYMDIFSSSAPTLQSANIQLPSATFAFGTGGLNNNNYYFPASNTIARTGAVGTTSVPTAFFATLANWQAAVTPQDANSIQADPQYVSATDLHIALASPNVNAGATGTGVVNDIDFQVRDAMPDIGADEPNGATAPANDIAASSIINPAPGATLINGTSTTPQARFYNAGSATQTGVMVQFTITGPGGYNYSNTQSIATIGADEFATVTFASAPTFTTAGVYMMSAQVLTSDSNASNDTVNGSFTVIDPLSGPYTVGAGGQFTSLTNPGGLFEALNTAGAGSNITANITTDLTGETGAVPLNQLSGGFGLTIKPSGAARTISGTAASLSMIKLNGADNVTIDGSLSGGTDQSLTILYTNTGGTVIWIAAQNASNGANNNTIKNCIIASNPGTVTIAGVLGGSGVTLGGPAEAQNNNNTVTNNQIFRVQNSIYNQGNTALDQNWTVTNNVFGSTVVADKNSFRGMLMGNAQNFVISGNVVNGISSSAATTAAMSGIQLAFNVNTGMVVNNRITDIRNNSGTGTGGFGMQLSASPALNVTIANNFISDVITLGSATIVNNGHGINVNGAASAGAYKFYHNSVNMNTNQTTGVTSAFNVTAAVVAAGAIDLRNNILANTQTAGATRRSVHNAAAANVFGTINYNDYFSTGSVGFIGGIDRPTLADWQTGTGQDANSKAVDPLFVSPTNLHIQAASPMINMGVAGTGITTDIDGQTRDATPDIGADEVIVGPSPGTLQFSAPSYSVGEAGPVATITVTRTSGSTGTVTVQYATVAGGTATGGASCGAGIDFVNSSGTLTFIDGDINETFTIPICQDAVSEGNETINLALSNPTGGAVLGAQATAVLTITDDDAPPGTLSISDVRMFEGNSGARNFVFTVSYSGASVPVSVQYATANGTAIAGTDYLAAAGTLNFPVALSPEGVPAPQTATITVVVQSDVNKEANETFFVNLSSPSGATIADSQGVGIIIDEDRAYVSDFDLDHTADVSVFRASEGLWYILQSTSLTPRIVPFGQVGDIAVPGDYDGDGITDVAVWRPSGVWYRILSSTGSTSISAWGTAGDKPVQGDYDGDGKTDLAVFRPSTGTWWILRSSNGASSSLPFGIGTDRPVQGDYDGDAKTDIAVYRDGTWYIARSSDGAVQINNFGLAADKPVSGDFDGDGKYDLAIYRDGVWWVLRSLTGTANAVPWGAAGDIPVPADYDFDGTTDFAIFRPSTGDWHILRSSNNTAFGLHWGVSGDVPIPAAYLPQ